MKDTRAKSAAPASVLVMLTVTLLVTAVPQYAAGQALDSTDYFPLRGGNTWTYYDVNEFAPPPYNTDTTIVGTFMTVDSLMVSDTLYFKAPYPHALADTLRSDSTRVYARVGGRDVLLFDFAMADTASYIFEDVVRSFSMEVTIERDLDISVAAGQFAKCVRFTFDDPLWADEGRSYTFAPGVGMVDGWGGMGERARLLEAEVNGVPITATSVAEEVEVVPGGEAYAYPNPFGASTTFSFPRVGVVPADVVVYDVLGRKVDVLRGADCRLSRGADRCEYAWTGRGLGSGIYFARVEAGAGSGSAARVVIRR